MRVPLLALIALAIAPAPASAGQRIVGGSTASAGYPAQAQVTVERGERHRLCGGTLVQREWVLTAAHCVAGRPRRTRVRLGSRYLGHGRSHYVDRIVRARRFDTALLHLAHPSGQPPLALAEPGTFFPLGRVLGWGVTAEGGTAAPQLREVDLPIYPDEACRSLFGGHYAAPIRLCAGDPLGGLDACQGDSGGPLMIPDGGGWAIAGVVSSGEGCARPGRLGVYTELANGRVRYWLATTVVPRRTRPCALRRGRHRCLPAVNA